jgi:hypothetical protein
MESVFWFSLGCLVGAVSISIIRRFLLFLIGMLIEFWNSAR